MAVQGCFAAHVVSFLPLKMWKASQHTAACSRQGTERSNRHFGDRPYGKLDFHSWERKPGALSGFIIGLGVPLDGETNLQPQHFTRNPRSEQKQCREFRDSEGWQDTSAAPAWGQLFRKSLSAGILGSWRAVDLPWQQWCQQLQGWVMWSLSWGMCHQHCSLLRAASRGSAYPENPNLEILTPLALTPCQGNSLWPPCPSNSQSTASFGLLTAA